MSRNEARARWSVERRVVAGRQRRRRSVRPAVLALEARSLMTAFSVTSTADGGAGSLRYELGLANAAGGDNTIAFDGGAFATAQTIRLTSGPLELSDTTGTETIVGPAAGLTITAGGQGRVFLVDPKTKASISGLTITGGSESGPGGGLMNNNGTVTLTDCTITGNTAANGGGVYTAQYGTTDLYGGAVTGNVATGNGGGIYDTGSMTLGNCVISGNSAGGHGGGLYNLIGGLTMTDVVVSGNTATSGGGLGSLFGTSTLTGCNFTGDVATASGGGLYSNGGTNTLTNCNFTGDLAAVDGGGIYNNASGTVAITGGTFGGNSAGWNGGALSNAGTTTLSDCTVSGNTAGAGGGLYGLQGTSKLYGVTVSSNLANAGAGIADNGGTTTLSNCLVAGNTASGAGGGLLNTSGTADLIDSVVSGNTAAQDGGVGTYAFGTTSLTDSTVSGNVATSTGGGVGNNDGATTLTNCTVSGNSAGTGGGLDTVNNGLTTVTDCTVSGNTAAADGGGLYVTSGGTTTMIGATVAANSASSGGGLDNAGGTVKLGNTIVAANAASTSGPDAMGTVVSLGTNLVGETDGSSGWVGSDLTGTVAQPLNPLLAPLGSYGGPTATMALLPGSPAINGGNNALIPNGVTTDQRGLERIIGGTVDIGAFESHLFTIAVTSGSGQSTAILTAFPAPLVATVTPNYSIEPVAGGLVTFSPPQSGPSAILGGNPATIATDGTVSVVAAANGNVGRYTIPAGANGITNTAVFTLTNQAVPTIATTPNVSAVTLGTSAVTLKDTATLANGYYETGTITFTLYLGSTLLDTETVSVNGDGSYATPTGYTLPASGTVVGTYQWDATYTGDPFNIPATENNATTEQTVVSPANPSIVTTSSAPAVTLGNASVTLTDTAVLSGGYYETGSITFTLYLGNTPVDTETVPVTGNGTYTTPTGFTLPTTGGVTGTYQWDATFTGDTNNAAAGEANAAAERTVVLAASPSIVTTPSTTAMSLGTAAPTLKDTAVLSGGYFEAGTITFTLVGPGGSTLDTETVSVNGNGPYTTPTGYTLPTAGPVTGTYQWNASYSGDANDGMASESGMAAERTAVSPATPGIVTTPSPASLTLSSSTPAPLNDGAAFAGGYFSTGTLTFTLTYNGSVVYTDHVAVNGNGTYSTATGDHAGGYSLPTTGTVVGTYQWNATYSGDANDTTATDQGGTSEQATVNPASPTIVTTPGGTVSMAGFTISGVKYLDATGDGFSADDARQGGVTINLYQVVNGSQTLVGSTITASDGTYSFSGYSPGTYQVAESVPSGYIQTGGGPGGAAGNTYYTINAVAGQNDTGNNFDDYPIPNNPGTSFVFKVTSGCSTTSVSTLSGHTAQGNTVSVALPSGSSQVYSLVVYTSPGATFSDSTAYQQTIYQVSSGSDSTATNHTLAVTIPNTYYQIDFVCGQAIGQLEPNQNNNAYGPDSAEILYHAQGRLISSDNGGTTAPSPMPTGNPATPPSAVTVPTSASTLTDTAVLSGGYYPGGTITFYLFAPGVTPNGSYGNNVYSDAVTINGDGTYSTASGGNPGGYSPTATGTFQWVAVYSGDSGNAAVADAFGAEPETVGAPSSVASGEFATIGFWQNQNGQATIKSFNGGPTATQLGNWLASRFPNLFGAKNPYTGGALSGYGATSLAGLTNAQVAAVYKSLWNPTGTTKNTYVQAFAVALGFYADTASLGGDSTAQGFGFNITQAGGSGVTYNVGSNGAAFGVPNNTSLSVYRILQVLNSNFSPSTGYFFGNNQGLTSAANSVVNGINTTGDVKNGLTLTAASGLAYTPAQIRAAYGIDGVSWDGTGQTIAIVDAYNDPAIFQAVDAFDSQFSLTGSGPTIYDQYGDASMFLTVLNQSGQADSLPSVDPNGPGAANWEMEEALDVEWIHAIAPGAQIVLVEANTQSLSDLMASAGTAAAQPGVSVVSMSWGFTEAQSVFSADEASYDSVFNVPGVTFLASTGDYGSANPEYPAFSPNVVAIGGTSLTLNADNSYSGETGWGGYSDAVGTSIGSGGGISRYETEPSFQQGVQSTGYRTTPDVSTVADPNTGAWIADPYNLDPNNPFEAVGGTSLSAPIWAGLVAMVNQGRAAASEAALNSSGPSETLQALYTLPQSDYNSITSGSNGYNANAGYNLVTGLGTPIAGSLVSDLVAYQGPGTTYSGPTVGPLLDATLSGSWTAGGGTANVFSVFNAMPVGHGHFTAASHGTVRTGTTVRWTNPQQGPVFTPEASPALPASPAPIGSFSTGSFSGPIGVVPTNDAPAAHDAVLAGWPSSQDEAAVPPVQVIVPGAAASRTSVLQGALVDPALEGFGALPSLLGTGDQGPLGKPRRSIV